MERKVKRLAGPGKRKVHIDGQVWTYTIGRECTRIVSPDRTKVHTPFHNELTGWSWDEIERGSWKGYWHITPQDIAAFIEIDILRKKRDVVIARLTQKARRNRIVYWEKNYPGVLTIEAYEHYIATGDLDPELLNRIVRIDIAKEQEEMARMDR